jgi:predicted NUDIX family phosphoesterase
MSKKRHQEFILAIDKQYFLSHPMYSDQSGIVEHDLGVFFSEVMPYVTIRQRAYLEQDPNYRQLIPYTIIRYKNADGEYQYYNYQRMSDVGEQRLAGNVSVGFGGHIDLADICFDTSSQVFLRATVEAVIQRELKEEVICQDAVMVNGDEFDAHISDFLIINDTNEVGKVHVGIIVLVDLLYPGLDACNEQQLNLLVPRTAAELLDEADRSGSDFILENWTRLYLEFIQHQEKNKF